MPKNSTKNEQLTTPESPAIAGEARHVGYKLFRKRKDGTYGPLFINARQRLHLNTWYDAEEHRTPGYAYRPGWHICSGPVAPHLSKKNRVWCKVLFVWKATIERPASQGGIWFLGDRMAILEELDAL